MKNQIIIYIFIIIILLFIIYYLVHTNNIKEKFQNRPVPSILTNYKNAEKKLGEFCTNYREEKPFYCKNCYDNTTNRTKYLNCFTKLNSDYGNLFDKPLSSSTGESILTEDEKIKLKNYNQKHQECILKNCKLKLIPTQKIN